MTGADIQTFLLRWYRRLRWPSLVLPLAYALWIGVKVAALPGPPPLPPETEETRFGLSAEMQKIVFTDVARRIPGLRRNALRRFPLHAWSRQDDYHAALRRHIHHVARRRKIHVSQVYLVLTEGIRQGWTGPNNKTVEAPTVPLEPRRF